MQHNTTQHNTNTTMFKDGTAVNGGSCSNGWSRVCDTCRSAACTVYCRADSAYLCSACDAHIHASNDVVSPRHERVRVCEACERAPAAFLCKADAASLCSSCDADIHSANPLASRHHRVPVLPIGEEEQGTLGNYSNGCEFDEENDEYDQAEAASWLLLNNPPPPPPPPGAGIKNIDESDGLLFGGEVDEYLDLRDCNSCGDNVVHHHQNYNTVPHRSYALDSVVPPSQMQHQQQPRQFQHSFEFDSSKAAFSYNGSVTQSVSVSSMEVGIVPESTISDASIFSHSRPSIGTVDLISGPPIQVPSYFTPEDREARVLRYREKKKTRKFEKKIRYASRKAYAETRPRIKGRFAKRTDVEADDVDHMFDSALMTEAGYSIVPSF